MQYHPNLRRVEIEITQKCNLKCVACDRRCSQAESEEEMPVWMIERFVTESIQLGYPWEKIMILGGEPTLHSEIGTIVANITRYWRTYVPRCEVGLVTNMHGEYVERVIEQLSPLMPIVRRPKSKWNAYFNNVDIAPVDVVSRAASCHILQDCGLGLNADGYYPCGASAAIARVLGIRSPIQQVGEIDGALLERDLQRYCSCCGHALQIPLSEDDQRSPFWREAYENYRRRNARQ